MQPITSQTLETERLILRAWRADDLEDFYADASEPGVGERAGWKHHESREESRRILESFIRAQEVFAVVLRSEQRAIGSLGVHPSWAAELPAFAVRLSAAREGDRVCTLQRLLGPRLDAGGRACGHRVRVRYAGTGGADRRAFSRKCAVEARD